MSLLPSELAFAAGRADIANRLALVRYTPMLFVTGVKQIRLPVASRISAS